MKKYLPLILSLTLFILLISGCLQPEQEEQIAPGCGNNVIDEGETCSSCPQDAACVKGKKCVNNVCEYLTVLDLCGNSVIDEGETSDNCCSDVGCANSSQSCVSNRCEFKTCGDGTQYTSCSKTKPVFCNKQGELVENCELCGCPNDLVCVGSICQDKPKPEPTSTNKVPEVDAGLSQDASLGSRVVLRGSGKDDSERLTYSWVQTHGSKVQLKDASSPVTSFYPIQMDQYVFKLTLRDEKLEASDHVTITVVPPEDYLFFSIGNNKLTYFNEKNELQVLPLSIKVEIPEKESEMYFQLGDKTYYYSMEINSNVEPPIKMLKLYSNGPKDKGEKIADQNFKDKEVFSISLDNKQPSWIDYYLFLVDSDNKQLWLVLKKNEFNAGYGRQILFSGTDIQDMGEVYETSGKQFYVPYDESFSKYGGDRGDDYFNIANFSLANTVVGGQTIRVFVDARTGKVIEGPIQNLNKYQSPGTFKPSKFTTQKIGKDEVFTYLKETINVQDGVLFVAAPKIEQE